MFILCFTHFLGSMGLVYQSKWYPETVLLQKYLLSSALHRGIYQLLPPLFLLHTFNVAPSSLLPSFPALQLGLHFFFFQIWNCSSCLQFRATTEAGHGLGCCYSELLHCSCARLSSTMGPLTQHRAPALTCRSWLMPGRTWAPWWAKATLEPDCPWKCCSQELHFRECWGYSYGSGNVL